MPSLHFAIEPTGLLSSLPPDPFAAGFAALAIDAEAAGFAGVGFVAGVAIAAAPFTPPWPEHAPRPPFELVPSVHVTVMELFAGVGAVAVVAAFAPFMTPPWPEQAPRPLVALVVPSLQVVAVA